MPDIHIHIHGDGAVESGPAKPKRRKARASKASAPSPPPKKKKKKLTAHNKFMSKELRALKKKHPRTSQSQLMKKANAKWRKEKKK